jgi:predicted DNA-binding antitoxin AbrB/MazE fold protein
MAENGLQYIHKTWRVMAMAQVVTAIYQDGVFKPLERVNLPEQEVIQFELRPVEDEWDTPFDPTRLPEFVEKYTLSPDLVQILTEGPIAPDLTLRNVLILNNYFLDDEPKLPPDVVRELCAQGNFSREFDPTKLDGWIEKYNLSSNIIEDLVEEPDASNLTLEDVLAFNAFTGTGNAGGWFDVEELCSREDIWDAE